MDNYKDYLEERIIGMYNVSNSVLLEEFKKQSKKTQRKSFIDYLKRKHPNDDIDKMIKSKSEDDKRKFAKKYQKDFDKWWIKRNVIDTVVDLFIWFF